MKLWSKTWGTSKQKRKQRKYRHNAPFHIKQKFVSTNLDKTLRKDYKKRSLKLRTGDEVMIMRGSHKGKSGKVSKIDLKHMKVFVDNIKIKKVSGQETNDPVDPSNLKITKLNLDDKKRMKFITRKDALRASIVGKKEEVKIEN